MKNVFKVLSIIAFVAIIGFYFAACDDGSGNGETPPPPPAHVHQWGDWTVKKAATCTATGEKTRTCALDATHTETGAEIPALGHDSGEWHTTLAATCTATGNRQLYKLVKNRVNYPIAYIPQQTILSLEERRISAYVGTLAFSYPHSGKINIQGV